MNASSVGVVELTYGITFRITLLLMATNLFLTVASASAYGSGSILWQKTWGGTKDDVTRSVAFDAQDDAYVTGFTRSFGVNQSDVFLLKYSSSGGLVWQQTWGGNGSETGNGVVVDSSGNVYIAGTTNSSTLGGDDAVLLKFTSSGNLVWQRVWGGNRTDQAAGVAVDSAGDIYLTGSTGSFGQGDCSTLYSYSPEGSYSRGLGSGDCNVFLVKFDSAGNILWQRAWSGNQTSLGIGVATDSLGNVYVTGNIYNSTAACSNCPEVFLLKFNSEGSLRWQTSWDTNKTQYAQALTVDSSGNAYIAGHLAWGHAFPNDFLLRFGPTGKLGFETGLTLTLSSDVGGLVADPSGNTYVSMRYFNGDIELGDLILLAKLNSTGSLMWSKTWQWGLVEGNTYQALDSSDNLLIAGYGGCNGCSFLNIRSVDNVSTQSLNAATAVLQNQLIIPSGSIGAYPGRIQAATGSSTYAGKTDIFLFKYSLNDLSSPTFEGQATYWLGATISFMAIYLRVLRKRIRNS